jgi:aryl-alcohol dehydrogenase-like predicted oxidoreductase
MQFGWTAGEAASFAVMDSFVEHGGNFLDTADIYSNWVPGHPGGEAEEHIGRWMKARANRDNLVLATKARGRMWDGKDGEGLGRSHLLRAVDDSLKRLQTDSIDLYQCHWPDEDTPIEETLATFGDLIQSGKVRYIGASNYTASQLEDAQRSADELNLPQFTSLQPHYNLVHRREFEGSLEGFCQRNSIGVIPYSPLAGGFLTGKYRKAHPLPKSQRAASVKGYMNERGFGVVDALERIADSRGVSASATALAWLLARPSITSPIIGANSLEQLSSLLPGAEMELTTEESNALNAASS